MNKYLITILALLVAVPAIAQLPYFAGTAGDGKMYGYSSLKVRPGINSQETYTTFQYGITDHLDTGIDLYTGPDCAYWGGLLRYGQKISKWYNIGGEVIPSFNLNHSFKFSYFTTGLYMNGAITNDSRLFWCSNTWWVVNNDAPFSLSNNEYLGFNIPLKRNRSITPMVGAIHSWKFDKDIDLTLGLYYTFNNWNLYLWSNDILTYNPRLIIGLDFIL